MQPRLFRNVGIARAYQYNSSFAQPDCSRCFANIQCVHNTKCIMRWGNHHMTPQMMQDLCHIGLDQNRRLGHTRFLRQELCIRFAHSVIGLWSLPHALTGREGINVVVKRHIESILSLESSPCPRTGAQDEEFTNLLQHINKKHDDVLRLVVQDVHSLAAEFGNEYKSLQPQVHTTLERFFQLRIGTRLLLQQHVESRGGGRPGFSGVLQLEGNLAEIARKAAQEIAWVCTEHVGEAPSINVADDMEGSMRVSPMCIPAVLSYLFREVFKNACRAVVERHADRYDDPLPTVQCRIIHDKTGLLIKISDFGGGICPADMAKVGRFVHSTSRSRDELAGYGVGLALSRLYAQYFGGEITLSSNVGVGTDVSFRTAWLGNHRECLPPV